MDNIGEKDCNSKELARLLIGSVQRLLNLEQWNSFTRLQAIEDPFRFIDEVAKHGDELEKEDDGKGFWHIRIHGIAPEGERNKINCIKTIRVLMGWGLADSKVSFEALPGSGHEFSTRTVNGVPYAIWTKAFSTQESVTDSPEYKELANNKHLFQWEVTRMPTDTPKCEPFKDPRY